MREICIDKLDACLLIFGFDEGWSELQKKLQLPEPHSRRMLLWIVGHGGIAPYGDLQKALRLSDGQMTHAVRGLIRAKVVTRVRSRSDARKIDLRLTKKAETALDSLYKQARTVEPKPL